MRDSINAYIATHTPFGRFWLAAGSVALVVDAGISYRYGISQTFLHGVGFALLAFFFAFLPDAAYREAEAGRKMSAACMAVLCIPMGVMAYYSHIGYGAGVRVGDIQDARASKVAFINTQDLVVQERGNLEALRTMRTSLVKERDDLKAAAPWAVTVTADGLRKGLAAIDEAISQEAKRVKCAEKCLLLKQQKAEAERRIGSIDKLNGVSEEIARLDTQIAGIQARLDKKTETAAATKPQKSSVTEQTSVGAKLYLAFTGSEAKDAINPDAVTFEFMNIAITGLGAFAFMLMAPIGIFLAGRNRIADAAPAARDIYSAPATPALLTAGRDTHTVERPTIIQNTALAEMLARATAPYREKLTA